MMKIVTSDDIGVAAAAVDAGDLVVVPTQRWYMLCGRADSEAVAARIFGAKHRATERTLLHVARSPAEARTAFVLNDEARLLADAFWPGDLALVLRWRDAAAGERMTAVGDTEVLVTCASGSLGELARLCAAPLAATSANISPHEDSVGTFPAITVAQVASFAHRSGADLAVVVDGGACPSPQDMTIVACTSDRSVMRRPGLVSQRSIEAVLAEHGRRLIPAD
jgi:L-threonylcarbamoyladenylate synthase